METVGTMCEGEWASFGGMFSTEEANFMSQFIGNYSFPTDGTGVEASSAFWPSQEPIMNAGGFDENLYYFQDNASSDSYCFPREGSYSRDSSMFPSAMGEESYYVTNNSFNSMNFCTAEEQHPNFMDKLISDNPMEEVPFLKDGMSGGSFGESDGGCPQNFVSVPDPKPHLKRKSEAIQPIAGTGNQMSFPPENPKKKSRVSVPKSKKNAPSKKNQVTVESSKNEEGNSSDMNGQSSSSYTSEDDTIVSQELSGDQQGSEATDAKCKTRAGRGSATDPQSIYARKRRERINERLRILQNLVPNGTKVDISTMLEEAVQYVKFLQVQIKLLSSDDLWMYAPLAYNGMDIGLDQKITLPR